MTIRNILVDGETAEFEYSPHWKDVDGQPSWLSVSCLKTAADAACSAYVSSLTSESVPNLIISSERSVKSTTELPEGENGEHHEENGKHHEENGGNSVQLSDDKAVKICNGSAEGNDKEQEKENKEEDEKENKKEEKTEMETEEKEREKDEDKETEEGKEKETEKEKEKEENEDGKEKEDVNENEKDKEIVMKIENEKVLMVLLMQVFIFSSNLEWTCVVVMCYCKLLQVKNAKLVRVDYILEKAETGVHFVNNVLHSNSQIRRAHCWFPCIDSATQRCP
jgi:transcription initiation factor TFIID subunit 2